MTAQDVIEAMGRSNETIINDALRSEYERGWDSRQSTVDNLLAELSSMEIQLSDAEEEVVELRDIVSGLEARIRELESNQPAPVVKTKYGACPASPGGASVSAAKRVVAKFGEGASIRQFAGNLAAPSVDPTFGLVHTSYKPDINAVANGTLDTQIANVVKAARDGDVLEIWHESDKKVRDGNYSLATCIKAKNRFYDVVKATNPNVLVASTYTGWLFEPRSGLNPDEFGPIKADILGVDADGIHVTKLPYPNYDDEIAGALRFIEKFKGSGYKYWAVPEFGTGRVHVRENNGVDVDGTVRAAWMKEFADKFEKAGALYVHWFDYNTSPGYELTTPAELNEWKSRI